MAFDWMAKNGSDSAMQIAQLRVSRSEIKTAMKTRPLRTEQVLLSRILSMEYFREIGPNSTLRHTNCRWRGAASNNNNNLEHLLRCTGVSSSIKQHTSGLQILRRLLDALTMDAIDIYTETAGQQQQGSAHDNRHAIADNKDTMSAETENYGMLQDINPGIYPPQNS